METTCIKCGEVAEHSLCAACADLLLNSYTTEDQMAYALLGRDVLDDKQKGIVRPTGYLKERLEEHKRRLKCY